MYAESYICTFTFIFYTCMCIPFLQTTQRIHRILSFLLNPHGQLEKVHYEETQSWELDLPVSCFEDSEFSNKNIGVAMDNDEEVCSICLMEFEKEDLVNKLPRCGHLFHMKCMEKWLDRCRFTCPLCRSMLLHATNSSSPYKSRPCIIPIPLP